MSPTASTLIGKGSRRGGTARPDRVLAYARSVVAGEIVTGELVRLACERHLDDLKRGAERGLRWNQAEADRVMDLFGCFRQYKGEWAGKALTLLPWQQFVVGAVFGWERWDEERGRWLRRFTEAYVSVARKNGKSTIGGGFEVVLLDFVGEAGAEVYVAATKREQARECHDTAVHIVQDTPGLHPRIQWTKTTNHLVVPATRSKVLALGRDSDSEHGKNPNGYIIDELHVHPNRDMVDALETATGARAEPLGLYITTAGIEGASIYTETDDRAQRVVRGIEHNDRMFVYIATLDRDDDWRDPSCYIKSNPSLGETLQLSDLIAERDKAMKTPGRQNTFKRLRLNMRTGQETAWFDLKQWGSCHVDELSRTGRTTVGVDLGGNRDLSAALRVTMDAEGIDIEPTFWMPRDKVQEASERDQVPYQAWIEAGHIIATEGDYRDDDAIAHDLIDIATEAAAIEVDIDAWQSGHVTTVLADAGIEVVKVPQTFAELGQASEYLENAITKGTLHHAGNPVMTWMIANVSAQVHPEGTAKKPSKRAALKHRKHIDGVSALVTALARLIRMENDAPDESVYEQRLSAGEERLLRRL